MADKKKSFLELIVGAKADKQEWRRYVKRREALPPDYRAVMGDIEQFMYHVGMMDGSGMTVFYNIIDLFEEGASQQRPVLEVTGDDVADFAYNVLMAVQAETWTGQQARKLNAKVKEHLAHLEGKK